LLQRKLALLRRRTHVLSLHSFNEKHTPPALTPPPLFSPMAGAGPSTLFVRHTPLFSCIVEASWRRNQASVPVYVHREQRSVFC
ncbi:hypothetical protein CSUI_007186, partial [Cystoisospora suis]